MAEPEMIELTRDTIPLIAERILQHAEDNPPLKPLPGALPSRAVLEGELTRFVDGIKRAEALLEKDYPGEYKLLVDVEFADNREKRPSVLAPGGFGFAMTFSAPIIARLNSDEMLNVWYHEQAHELLDHSDRRPDGSSENPSLLRPLECEADHFARYYTKNPEILMQANIKAMEVILAYGHAPLSNHPPLAERHGIGTPQETDTYNLMQIEPGRIRFDGVCETEEIAPRGSRHSGFQQSR